MKVIQVFVRIACTAGTVLLATLISATASSGTTNPSMRVLDANGNVAEKEIRSVRKIEDPWFGPYLEFQIKDHPSPIRMRFEGRPADMDFMMDLSRMPSRGIAITAPRGKAIPSTDSEIAPDESSFWISIRDEKSATEIPLAQGIDCLRIKRELDARASPDQRALVETISRNLRERTSIAPVRSFVVDSQDERQALTGLDQDGAPVYRRVGQTPSTAVSLP